MLNALRHQRFSSLWELRYLYPATNVLNALRHQRFSRLILPPLITWATSAQRLTASEVQQIAITSRIMPLACAQRLTASEVQQISPRG